MATTVRNAYLDLFSVRVRPTLDRTEHGHWDRLVAAHHNLSLQSIFGRALRHVATLDGTWLVPQGWQRGAPCVAVRNCRIGWSLQEELRRLYPIARKSGSSFCPP